MFILVPQKVSKIRDGYVLTAIINFIGMIVVTDIIRYYVGWMSFLIMLPIYIYFTMTSITLALSRCWIIEKINRAIDVMNSTARQLLRTERMLNPANPRKLYQRRILLLQKRYRIYVEIFSYMNRSLDKLKNMRPNTLQAVTDILNASDNVAKTKIFLDK